ERRVDGHTLGGLADHGDEFTLIMSLASAWWNHDRITRMTQRRRHFVKNLGALWGFTTSATFRDVQGIVESQCQEFTGCGRHQQFNGIDRIDHAGRGMIPEQVPTDLTDIFALGNAVFRLSTSLETDKFHR